MSEDKRIEDEVLKEMGEKKDDEEFEDVCFMCRRPESKTGKMVHMAQGVCVCQQCMQKAFDSMGNGRFPYGNIDISKMPNIGMINLSDLTNQMPKQQKVKKKKTKEEPKKAFDVKSIPAPHKIKASLDEYVIGQEHAKDPGKASGCAPGHCGRHLPDGGGLYRG